MDTVLVVPNTICHGGGQSEILIKILFKKTMSSG